MTNTYCLFCGQLYPPERIQAQVIKIELQDVYGVLETLSASGRSMPICELCREKTHRAIENNSKLVKE